MSKLMIIAGEPSGDLHGGQLVAELRRLRPDLEIFGVGGDRMQAAGMELIYHIRDFSFMGGFGPSALPPPGDVAVERSPDREKTRGRGADRLSGLQSEVRPDSQKGRGQSGLFHLASGLGLGRRPGAAHQKVGGQDALHPAF